MRRVIALFASLASACSSLPAATTDVSAPSTAASVPGEQTTTSTHEALEGDAVVIPTDDGVILEGRLFGSSETFVVLAHMRSDSMESWFSFARAVAAEGHSALVFNFRGVGESQGEGFAIETDAVGAVDYTLSRGAELVYLIGASMGGTQP